MTVPFGTVTFLTAPDFESPTDSDGDNDYKVTIRVSDGVLFRDQLFTVRVLGDANPIPDPVNPDPVTELQFTNVPDNGRLLIQEGSTLAIDLDAVSPTGNAVTYELVGGADVWQMTLDSATGELSFFDVRNFENPSDIGRDNVYDVDVKISDGESSLVKSISLRVNDDPEPLDGEFYFTNLEDESTIAILEGRSSVITIDTVHRIPQISAASPDATALDQQTPVSYFLNGGDDAFLFNLHPATGELSFVNPPDFEVPNDADRDNTYEVNILARTGQKVITSTLMIKVEDSADGPANDLPLISQLNDDPVVYVSEGNTFVGEFAGDDPDNDLLSYTLVHTSFSSGGRDLWLFTIDETTGRVEFVEPPSFDTPVDFDGDNEYDLVVRAFDGVNFRDHDLRVRVRRSS